MAPRVAHVVRAYGGLTEPFIEQRVLASGEHGELWYEQLAGPKPTTAIQVDIGAMRPGSPVDRLFHRLPILGRLGASAYRATEATRRPEVIHAHYLTTGYLVGNATRSPLVVSTYGFDVGVIPRRPRWRAAIRSMVSRPAAILAEGPVMARRLMELGFAERCVRIVPIAAHLDTIPYRDPRPPSGPIRLLVCGRLVEKKGHTLAIEAFHAIRSYLPPQSQLMLVGGGPLEPRLRDMAARLGLQGQVAFLGPRPRGEYLDILGRADLVLVPSVTARNGDTEGGAPTTILDAQASGVVTVASRHADIPFLVAEAETGFLADEGSAESLAAAIQRALASVPAWVSVARRAREQVDRRHSDVHVGGLLNAIHEEVAAQ